MRRQARELSFKYIYMSLYNCNDVIFEEFCKDEDLNEKVDIDFAKNLIELWQANKEEINQIISASLVNYELNRVYKIDLALINLAVTEIKFYKETPNQVVINEIIELAKIYSTEKSYSFINGILSSILKGNDGK